MDLDLKELGITFIVGAFTIAGLEAILHHFFNVPKFTGLFQKREKPPKGAKGDKARGHEKQDKEETEVQSMRAAVFIGIAFAIGICAEGLSYKYVDSVETPLRLLPISINSQLPSEFNKNLGLPSKEGSRVKTLIINLNEKPEIQPLALELAKNKAFSQVYPDTGEKVEKWIYRINQCSSSTLKKIDGIGMLHWFDETCLSLAFDKELPSNEEITSSIYRLYYYAIDRVYLERTYYDEMREIEIRRDFLRSISLIACFYLMVAIVSGLVRTGYLFIKNRTRRHGAYRRYEIFKKTIVVLILFLIYFLSMWAYEREADEFNKRAFGYYSAMLLTEKLESNKSGSRKEDRMLPSAPSGTTHSTDRH